MFKKLISRIVLGMMVVGFCMAAVPQDEAEAAAIQSSGTHKHKKESGIASCKGQAGQGTSKSFTTSSPVWGTPNYSVTLSGLISDLYTVTVKGKCGASASKSNVKAIGYGTTRITINY